MSLCSSTSGLSGGAIILDRPKNIFDRSISILYRVESILNF